MHVTLRRSIATLAIGASAFAGGALIAGPMVAGAQEDQPQQENGGENTDQDRPPCRPGHGRHLEAAAEGIGIEPAALRDALEGGQTIAEVAQAHGVEVQAAVDALVADATERIDQAVADERFTQEEADQKKADLNERITAVVNGERPEGGPRGARGGGNGPPAEDETENTSTSS